MTRQTREIGGAVVCFAEVMLALDEDQVVEIARSVLASGGGGGGCGATGLRPRPGEEVRLSPCRQPERRRRHHLLSEENPPRGCHAANAVTPSSPFPFSLPPP